MANNGNEMKYKITVDTGDAQAKLKKFQSDLNKAFDSKGVTKELNKMTDKINSSMKEVNTKMNKAFNMKGATKEISKFSSEVNKQVKKIGNSTRAANKAGKDLGKALLKGFQSALTGISAIGKIMFNALRGLASSFLSIGRMFGTMISTGLRIATGVLNIGKQIAGGIAKGIRAGYSLIKGAVNGVTKIISTGLKGALAVTSSVTGKMTDMISKAINQTGSINMDVDMGSYQSPAYNALSGDTFNRSLSNLLSGMKATLPKQIGSIFESVAMGTVNSFSKLNNAIQLVAQMFVFLKKNSANILSTFAKLGSMIKPYLASAFNLIGSYFKLQMGTTFAPLKQVFSEVINKVRETGTAFINTAKEFVSSNSGITQMLAEAIGSLHAAIEKLSKGPFTRLREAMSKCVKSFLTIGPEVKRVLGPWVGALAEYFKGVYNWLSIIIEPIKGLAPLIKPLANLIKELVRVLGLACKGILKVVNVLTKPIRSFAESVKGVIHKMSTAAGNFMNGITNFLRNLNPLNWFGPRKDNATADAGSDPEIANQVKESNDKVDSVLSELDAIENNTDPKHNTPNMPEMNMPDDPTSFDLGDSDSVSVDADTSGMDRVKNQYQSIIDKAKEAASKITNSLNNINTDNAEQEVQKLQDEFEQAKAAFREQFKLDLNTGDFKGKLGSVLGDMAKYSDMLAKIKNPLLTIRTEKAKAEFKSLMNEAQKTKDAFNKFKQTSAIDSAMQSSGDLSVFERIQSKAIKAKDALALLKSAMKTSIKFKAFESTSASIAKAEADMKKFKSTIQNVFKSMFSRATGIVKSGWEKIVSRFKGGAAECETTTNKLGGLLRKVFGLIGAYQLGSLFVDATKSAVAFEGALSNIQRTLGASAQGLIDFANEQAVAFGLSKQQVMEFGNIYSLIVSNFEKDQSKVAATTQGLLEAAGTIAAGTGYSVNEVLEALRSGINGSSEAVDQLGLNLKVANLQAKAGVENWNDLTTEQQQAIITQEILNQTAAKYGGIVKNTASMQNAFAAQLANTKLALGNVGKAIWTVILPPLTKLLAVLEVVFNKAASVMATILELFGVKVDFGSSPAQSLDGGTSSGVPATNLGTDTGTDVNESLKDSNKGLSDSYDGVGDSASDAADAVEDSAKKMKGSLAGIDEINVLSFDKGDSDSSKDKNKSGSGVDGIGDIPSFSNELGSAGALTASSLIEGFSENGLGDKIKNIFEPFLKAWENMSPRLLKAIEAFKNQFGKTMDALGDYLKSVWNRGGKEFTQHMAEIALAIATVAIEISTRLLEALEKMWRYLDPATNGTTQAFIDAFNEAAVVTRDFILGITEHFDHLMDLGGDDVLKNFADSFHKYLTACAKIWTQFMLALDGLLDHLDPIVNAFTKAFLDDLNKAIITVGDVFLAFAELIKNFRENGRTCLPL